MNQSTIITNKQGMENLAQKAAQHASESLSNLIHQEVLIKTFFVEQTEPQKLTTIDKPDALVSNISMSLEGDLNGYLSLLTDKNASLNLVDLVSNKPLGTTKILKKLDMSALKEIGNIIGSAFVTSMANDTKMDILTSPPSALVGTLKESLDPIIKAFLQKEGEALVFKVDYIMGPGNEGAASKIVPEIVISSRFILILDYDSFEKLNKIVV